MAINTSSAVGTGTGSRWIESLPGPPKESIAAARMICGPSGRRSGEGALPVSGEAGMQHHPTSERASNLCDSSAEYSGRTPVAWTDLWPDYPCSRLPGWAMWS